jgi:Ca-activated chloride channel family protein
MLNNWNILYWEYDFLSPHWLWLLVIMPILIFLAFKKEYIRKGDFKFTGSNNNQNELKSNWIQNFRYVLLTIQMIGIALLIVAMARPFNWNNEEAIQEKYKNGIDIVIAMDVSESMMAMDFEPNRLEASKKLAKEFIDGRQGDRIGLVAYAGEAYTACPTTLNYEVLKNQIDLLGNADIEKGTAIGTGLGTAVTRLRNDSLPSKVIILLTDGSNNAGDIDPITAAELAKAKNIRVYTIGVGSNGEALYLIRTPFGERYEKIPVEIDENTLSSIANITNGKYFRATDARSLKSIYEEIDQMEKTKKLTNKYIPPSNATPVAFLNWSLLLLLFSWISKKYLFRLEA